MIETLQELVDKYGVNIKVVNLILKSKLSITFNPGKEPVNPGIRNLTSYQQDFSEFTERYRDTVQEVRVIFKDGLGASQFFPRGTSEKVVWASMIPKEELG